MDHFRALPGSRRPHRARRRHACPRPLAMEYDRILWLIERTSGLRSGASRTGGLETVPARSQVPVEERTQRLMVNRRASRGWTLGFNPAASTAWNYCMPGLPRKPTRPTWPTGLSPRTARPPRPDASEQPDQFRSLNASLLYCPSCRVATPTRERLLLVLPTGNLYEYLCQHCGTSTGSKTDNQ
jgi:hypothetical protein